MSTVRLKFIEMPAQYEDGSVGKQYYIQGNVEDFIVTLGKLVQSDELEYCLADVNNDYVLEAGDLLEIVDKLNELNEEGE